MLRLPPCGLINCGNSCFANVVLQCLTYTRPLTAYLSGGIHGEACRRNDWCFMCELQQHVCRVKQSQNPFSPIRILSRIRNIGNHLGYGRQEDAHEFMRFAIDSMQSICLDEFGGEKAVDPRTQETTLIHHIFGGHLQSQVKCMQCQHESNRYESMMDLAVEIQGFVESLEDALAQFTAPECLDGDNKYKCDRCNAYVQARKRLTIHEAPNVLTIALKRFQSGKFGKLNKRVTFPEVLDISPYMSGKGDSPPAYQLYAVVVHVDMLNASFFGHYICYVKNSLGSWYKIDDSKVKEVDLDKVLAQKAYMLFYSRSNARPAPMVGLDGGYSSSSTRASTLLRDGIAVANGHHASGYYSPRVHAFASKVPGVMPAITGTLCVGNGSLQRVGEGHGSSWIQDGGGLVSLDSVSPWTDDVEMVSINADDTTEDAQNPDSGYVDADYRMSVGESNQDRQEELVACCGPPDVSSDQLLQAGKRRLEAGVSLPLSKGLDDWLPPSANHSRSSSCPSSLHATSDCLLSSSSLTPDVCSGATDSIESEYNLSDIGGNQNGCFPDAGERGEIASDLALEIFQVDLVARAKRQHIECKTNGTQSSVIRKSESSDSTMDMEWAELECEEPDSVSEAKSEAPEPEVPGCDQMKRLPEASLGIQGVSSLSACELFPCQGGITQGLPKSNSPHPISSSRAYQDFGGVQHSAKLEGSVSSVADDLTGCLDGVSTVVRTSVHQLASNGTVQDKGLKLEPVITNAGVASSNSSIPRVQTKLKPLISPGFLNRSHGPKGRPKAVASKRKTGEDISVACPEEDSNGLMACVVGNTGKQLSGAALRNDPHNGLLHSRVVENGVSNGPPQKGRVKSMRAGMSGSGRSGGNASGATLVGGEPVPLHFKESSTNQAVKATQNGGKVAASRQKQGRNEICACGSQRKWKKCCGIADVMKVESRRVVV